MNIDEEIVRLAARGDGVTASGRHIAGAVPGDRVSGSTIFPGLHRVRPPCRHFGRCGGCQLQHADDAVLGSFVADRIGNALLAHGLAAEIVLPVHLSPPRTRRRAVLHLARKGEVALGFREAGSHRVVDMRECHILHPALFALAGSLRAFVRRRRLGAPLDIALTLADQGVDCAIKGLAVDGLQVHEELLAFAGEHRLARLSVDAGCGADILWEPEPVTISFAGVAVPLPVGAFLQATVDGEAVLQNDVAAFCASSQRVADLFAGLGTLSLPLIAAGRAVSLFEADQAAHLATRQALGRMRSAGTAVHRDLFRAPLQTSELGAFDTVVLDPPRAGAKAQAEQLANSDVARVVYVSCNPASWARDAGTLTAAGFRLRAVRPVGQFRWSTHVELTSLFTR